MLGLRAHVLISAGLLAALILLAVIAGALQSAGIVKTPDGPNLPLLVVVLILFTAFGLSLVPVMVKLVLRGHRAIGAADAAIVKAAARREGLIIWAIWSVMGLGALIAIPAAILDNFDEPGRGTAFVGKSNGTLAAKPGMSVAAMVQGSTLKIEPLPNAAVISGDKPFDFAIPGTRVVLAGCRYFYVTTFTRDPTHIQGMSVGVSYGKLTVAERDAADAVLREKLAADGWLTGHEVYRTEDDRTLHGGASEGKAGDVWLKDGVVLSFEDAKVDEAPAGTDPDKAPVWIQAISLRTAADYTGFERLVFAPPEKG